MRACHQLNFSIFHRKLRTVFVVVPTLKLQVTEAMFIQTNFVVPRYCICTHVCTLCMCSSGCGS